LNRVTEDNKIHAETYILI